MDTAVKKMIWQQFGAAIDTLDNAMRACPDKVWYGGTKYHQFWYMAYHTIFWLDYYLSAPADDFAPPEPFTMSEMDPAGIIPDPAYTKEQLHTYLAHCRSKCRVTIEEMTDEQAGEMYKFGKVDLSIAELLLYSMRHVQHHAAQLNLILRQETNSAPGWVFKAKD